MHYLFIGSHVICYAYNVFVECKYTSRGYEYNGFQSKTKSGLTCQNWMTWKVSRYRQLVKG